MDLLGELSEAVKDVEFGTKEIVIHNAGGSDASEIYMTLVTLEARKYLVRLDPSGFAAVKYQDEELEEELVFESIISLLHSLSPMFTEKFALVLRQKLENND